VNKKNHEKYLDAFCSMQSYTAIPNRWCVEFFLRKGKMHCGVLGVGNVILVAFDSLGENGFLTV
jgi:hypothetical protein